MGLNSVKQVLFMIKRGWPGVILLAGFFNAGCSTPVVPYTNPDPQETSWYAYQQCLAALPRTANASACDNVGTTANESSYFYTGQADTASIGWPQGGLNGIGYPNQQTAGTGPTTSTGDSSGYRGYSAGAKAVDARKVYDLSYREYLQTLDEATLSSMKERWLELSASGHN